jgi:hypothetical protein
MGLDGILGMFQRARKAQKLNAAIHDFGEEQMKQIRETEGKQLETLKEKASEAVALFEELQNPGISTPEFFQRIGDFNEGSQSRIADGEYHRFMRDVTPTRKIILRTLTDGRITIAGFDSEDASQSRRLQ